MVHGLPPFPRAISGRSTISDIANPSTAATVRAGAAIPTGRCDVRTAPGLTNVLAFGSRSERDVAAECGESACPAQPATFAGQVEHSVFAERHPLTLRFPRPRD